MSSHGPEQFVPTPEAQDKGPLSFNLGFLKALAEKRTTREGNPPKRRGPKPDSKPALTRRQELNRQAQRTHRERKELYIKALEDEVLRLKEVFSIMSQDRDKLAEENRQLKQMLAQHGISWNPGPSGISPPGSNIDDMISTGYAASNTGGYGQAFTPPITGKSAVPSVTSGSAHHHPSPPSQSHAQQHIGYATTTPMAGQQMHQISQQQLQSRGVDMDQAGIDFVLTLEKPCMEHMPWLLELSSEMGAPCGHALMASCPPERFLEAKKATAGGNADVTDHVDLYDGASNPIDAGGQAQHAERAQHGESAQHEHVQEPGKRTWEVSKGDLSTLLDLSKRLDLDGEITPVMAWGIILGHPRLSELREQDFAQLTEVLKGKIRCHGFGAVLEEFEVRDAIENALAKRETTTQLEEGQMVMAH